MKRKKKTTKKMPATQKKFREVYSLLSIRFFTIYELYYTRSETYARGKKLTLWN